MAKSLSARTAQRKAQGARNGKNKASFLAVRDQVREALDDGWSMFAIWETLHEEGSIAFSYTVFCRYVWMRVPMKSPEAGVTCANR
ncbi:MAG: TraK family protein [Deltaproteobacteria bacterium]|nr:TraK family protein [Deltaproteobacteria bacterium]